MTSTLIHTVVLPRERAVLARYKAIGAVLAGGFQDSYGFCLPRSKVPVRPTARLVEPIVFFKYRASLPVRRQIRAGR